jgi:hypothetical protein
MRGPEPGAPGAAQRRPDERPGPCEDPEHDAPPRAANATKFPQRCKHEDPTNIAVREAPEGAPGSGPRHTTKASARQESGLAGTR